MYNKSYNTRHSGRFNNPGTFVPAGEMAPAAALYDQASLPQRQQFGGNQRRQQPQQQPPPPPPPQEQQQQPPPQKQQQSNLQEVPLQPGDVEMKQEVSQEQHTEEDMTSKNEDRPAWMKSKLAGVKKISNKERRRRQNETLRRLVTPKNALMVLNEMLPHDQLANQFRVEAAGGQFYSRNQHSFCADLVLEGTHYKGFGENKLSARNSAAEQAIRDVIIRKMQKLVSSEAGSQNGDDKEEAEEPEEALPMIQLASFALHKLFSEWESEGHRVPNLRPNSSVSEGGEAGAAGAASPPRARSKPPKGPRALPLNAAAMHPCMLLTYMRPHAEYRELAAAGDKPQNMVFTMGVDVEGATYIGKASNKKEARKQAARTACTAIFGTKFDDVITADGPQY